MKQVAEGVKSGVPHGIAVRIMELHTFIEMGLDDGAPDVYVGLGPHAEDLGHELGRIDLSHQVSPARSAHRAATIDLISGTGRNDRSRSRRGSTCRLQDRQAFQLDAP
jgi:hypothetical protein